MWRTVAQEVNESESKIWDTMTENLEMVRDEEGEGIREGGGKGKLGDTP